MNLTVGEKIKKYRLEKGMTQEELGKELGVGKAAVQKYESGQVQNLKSAHIKTLCTIFNTIPWDFIFDGSTPTKNVDNLNNEFLNLFKSLNQKGQSKVIEYTNDILKINEYRIKSSTIDSSTLVQHEKYEVELIRRR